MTTFSIIMTTYNSSKTIDATLNSILSQEGIGEEFNLEVIVLDDHSTDNTLELLGSYSNIITLQTTANTGGPNTGRNIGLKACIGEWICIADHDDLWEPFKIKRLLPHLYAASIITSGYTLINEQKVTRTIRIRYPEQRLKHFQIDATFKSKLSKSKKGQNTYLGAIVYHEKLKHILFEEEFGMVDFDWVVRLFEGQHSAEIAESLYIRIVEGSNLSLNPRYREIDFNYSLEFIQKYQLKYPQLCKMATQRVYGSRARYFYLVGDMKQARHFLRQAPLDWKTALYFVTSFIGANWVKKNFNIFG